MKYPICLLFIAIFFGNCESKNQKKASINQKKETCVCINLL